MPDGSGVFATLPSNFFSPLARANREHYAALLILFFRLFQENSGKLERELVVRGFTDYVALHRDSLAAEAPEAGSGDGRTADNRSFDYWPEEESGEKAGEDTETPFLDFGDAGGLPVRGGGEPGSAGNGADDRAVAGRFLRRLIQCGWLGEETLADYTRVINITPHARPFFEALARVEEGLKTEYESHVVAIYSLLCGDAVQENGHYAALNAHNATTALIDSLKVLSQSIKGHYDRFIDKAASAGISDLLHLHYDIYANDILDGAYKRLKTSDNLSRYRPRIIKKVGELLNDEPWLEESSRKLSRLGSATQAESRLRLCTMLEEIRDTLRAVDPLLDDIDRRNMLYARSSFERVKTLLEPDSTIAGKLGSLIREIYAPRQTGDGEKDKVPPHLRLFHRLHGIRVVAPGSLYRRNRRETVRLRGGALTVADRAAQKRVEAELLLRLRRQLSPAKISGWLDELGGRDRALPSRDLVRDEDSFGHFIYSLLYADSRPRSFDYAIEENPGDPPVETAEYVVPDLALRRKR
jgi:hypothetical protein